MTAFTVEFDDTNLRIRLAAMGPRVRAALLRAVTESAIDVQGKVQAKLAGVVLNERTHRLHDSIHYQITDDSDGVTATVGTDVVYARIHEYGGTVTVREHLMHMTQMFGHPLETPRDVLVREHTATYPERSFLRSTLREETPTIRARLTAAVRGAAAP
jgi:phage gpG-like protein